MRNIPAGMTTTSAHDGLVLQFGQSAWASAPPSGSEFAMVMQSPLQKTFDACCCRAGIGCNIGAKRQEAMIKE
jgi:hypothetical protein